MSRTPLASLCNSSPIKTRILSILGKTNLCDSCKLRFLGIRDIEIHRKYVQHTFLAATVELSNTEVKKLKLGPVCAACLGILQFDFFEKAKNAMEILNRKGYKLSKDTFSMFLQLPTQLLIRQQAVNHYIRSEEPEIIESIEVKEIFKQLIREAFELESGLTFDVDSPFSLSIKVDHQETTEDYMFLTKLPFDFTVQKSTKRGKTVYHGASNEKILRALSKATMQDFFQHSQCPPSEVSSYSQASIDFHHAQIFVAGRYCKLKRHISNSAWIIKGKRMTDDSVEELIERFLKPVFKYDSFKFSSSGREDSDVLMLGRGRPFYFELSNPKVATITHKEMSSLANDIATLSEGKIAVNDLQLVTKQDTLILRNSAATKRKSYRCKVELGVPVATEKLSEISAMKELTLQQRNPTRVPSRADLTREKTIHSINIIPDQFENDLVKTVIVDLETSAGTYVKEFMHGDDGRTVPSLHSLLGCNSASVISLDVLEVFLDWPQELK